VKEPDSTAPALELLTATRPLLIGHRGYCARAPENTLPSFQLGVAAGAELVELDFHQSKDGTLFAIHDATLDRTTDARRHWKKRNIRISDRTAAEIETLDAGSWFDGRFAGAKIPRLSEALDLICGSGRVALIEHKSGDAASCVRLLREQKLINRVVVISFDWSYLREFNRLEPTQVLGALGRPTHLTNGRKPAWQSKSLSSRWLDALPDTGARIAVWNKQVTKASVAEAHARGLKVWIYTVNDVALARQLLDAGVNGIITNEVLLMKDFLAGRNRKVGS
jgi:glycerophosphoryl diester phosphodiesterase